MPGRAYTALLDVAVEQYGYVTTADERTLGLSRGNLRNLAHRGDAERIAHGLYRLKAVPPSRRDQLMEAALWPRGLGVISHDTALDLWELCDVNPTRVHVTIPPYARIRRHMPRAYAVHQRRLVRSDVTRIEGIPVVTVRRVILDGIERQLRGDLIDKAIETGRAIGELKAAALTEIQRARPDR